MHPMYRSAAATLAATLAAMAVTAVPAARANGVDDLRAFVSQVHTGRSAFTQTVTSPDGKKQKVSSGRFEFQRPSRFLFVYEKPYAQTIVGDGTKVWFHDPDLNSVTVRPLGDALGATPAAVLVSSSVDGSFTLAPQPDAGGLQWVLATPKASEGTIRSMKIGFKDHQLSQLEIADSFGQHSVLVFDGFTPNAAVKAEDFVFVVPKGADVTSQ
jgi:outer membrane lipoprotein carrier protein